MKVGRLRAALFRFYWSLQLLTFATVQEPNRGSEFDPSATDASIRSPADLPLLVSPLDIRETVYKSRAARPGGRSALPDIPSGHWGFFNRPLLSVISLQKCRAPAGGCTAGTALAGSGRAGLHPEHETPGTLSGIPRRPSPPEPAGGVALMRASNPAIRPSGCRSLGRVPCIDRTAQ